VWLTEAEVASVLSLPRAIDAVESAFAREAEGGVIPMAKTHATWHGGHTLHAIGAVDLPAGLVGTKTWAHTSGGATPLIQVWDAETGELLAIIEAFALGQLRTGAVSGVATRRLARREAQRFAIIGTGKQALAQVAAVAAVQELTEIVVHSPSGERREAFARRVEEHGFAKRVVVARSVSEAVDGADIVTTVTRSREPILTATDLAPGTHVNAIGAITPERQELSADVFDRCGPVVADSVAAARSLATELAGVGVITPLAEVVAADDSFVRGADLSVFKAMGVGLADLALAGAVLDAARARGLGGRIAQPTRVAPRLKEDV
jgi:alanine dehydrogenase